MARELSRAVQNLRKKSGLAVSDRIHLGIEAPDEISGAIEPHLDWLASETLATSTERAAVGGAGGKQDVTVDGLRITTPSGARERPRAGARVPVGAPRYARGPIVGATTISMPRVRDGVLAFESARGFGALHRRMGFAAITFGHVVIANRPLDDRLWAHELVHVRQWQLFGPVMLLAYPLASIAGYRRNPFEAAARRKAGA